MFGTHDIPVKLEIDILRISVEEEGKFFSYRRESLDEKAEKVLLAKAEKLILHPVEPVNKPKAITEFLMIEFGREVVIEPKARMTVFVTFPVEIGVFVSDGRKPEILDIFTLVPQKYTLYGSPRGGTVCRHWKSEVHSAPPSPDPLHEGVMELKVLNDTPRWAKITRAVFNAVGMKIYFSDDKVGMKARMNIESKGTAETEFNDSPLEKDMKKSRELFTGRLLSVGSSGFNMEEGL
ncbi:MAG: DUF432 domain-containing protein [bacterium]